MCLTLEKLMDKFGYSVNSKGFKVLPSFLRVIQGDEVTLEKLREILQAMEKKGFSAENAAFGMGGGLLQKLHRDILKFAMKASAAVVNGVWRDVYKEPVTDPAKTSKKGRLALIHNAAGEFESIPLEKLGENVNILEPVFTNGKILKNYTFKEIRERAGSY